MAPARTVVWTTRRAARQAHQRTTIPVWQCVLALFAVSVLAVGVLGAVRASMSTPNMAASPSAPSAPPPPEPTIPPPPAPAGYAFDSHRVVKRIVFCIDDFNAPRADVHLRDIAVQALDLWQSTTNDQLPIALGDNCSGAGAHHRDGISVIAWEPLAGSVVGEARFRSASVIDEADVVLDSDWTAASSDCLLAVALHELGHVFGLDHQDDPDSIMKPVTDCRPSLSRRDIDAVRHLYD